MSSNAKTDEATKWRLRANEAADKAERYRTLLEMALGAFDVIVHTGYTGDKHVDVAQEARVKIREGIKK